MSNGSELKSPGAQALREAGYLPLPRWWVTREQMDLIEYMVRENQDEVNKIREEAHNRNNQEWRKQQEVERAWAAMKAGKGST